MTDYKIRLTETIKTLEKKQARLEECIEAYKKEGMDTEGLEKTLRGFKREHRKAEEILRKEKERM